MDILVATHSRRFSIGFEPYIFYIKTRYPELKGAYNS